MHQSSGRIDRHALRSLEGEGQADGGAHGGGDGYVEGFDGLDVPEGGRSRSGPGYEAGVVASEVEALVTARVVLANHLALAVKASVDHPYASLCGVGRDDGLRFGSRKRAEVVLIVAVVEVVLSLGASGHEGEELVSVTQVAAGGSDACGFGLEVELGRLSLSVAQTIVAERDHFDALDVGDGLIDSLVVVERRVGLVSIDGGLHACGVGGVHLAYHCAALKALCLLVNAVEDDNAGIHRRVVGEGGVGNLLDGVVLIYNGVVGIVGALFVEEAEGVVLLPRHGAISRAEGGGLMTAVPILGNVGGRVEVAEVLQGLVVDTHARTASTEGNGLEEEVHLLVVFLAHNWHEHHFAVGGVATDGDTVVATVGGGHIAPGTFALLDVGEGVDVVVAATAYARTEEDRAVGQFFTLGLIATRSRTVVDGAKHVPGGAEVVGVDDAVALVLGPYGAVKAVVVLHLDIAALGDTARTDKEGFHGGLVVLVNEEAVDAFGHVLGLGDGPFVGLLVVGGAHTCHGVGVGGGAVGNVVTVPANHSSADTHDEHFVALAVGHYGSIAEAHLPLRAGIVAQTVGEELLFAPGLTVVLGDAVLDVHLAVADVRTTGTVVGDGEDMAVGSGGDGGNAVGLRAAIRHVEFLEGLGLLYGLLQDNHKVLQRHALVATRLGERGGALLEATHADVLLGGGRGIGVAAHVERFGALEGGVVDEVETIASHYHAFGGRDSIGRCVRSARRTTDIAVFSRHVVDTCAQREAADLVAFPDGVPSAVSVARSERTVGRVDDSLHLHEFKADGRTRIHAFSPEGEGAQATEVVHGIARAVNLDEVAVNV